MASKSMGHKKRLEKRTVQALGGHDLISTVGQKGIGAHPSDE